MYNVVRESSLYYKQIMDGEGYRESLISPFILITDLEKYHEAKKNNQIAYGSLCDIICRMKELYDTGDEKYHGFGNFLRELEDVGFDINNMKIQNVTGEEILKDQIELMRMFMCFKYYPR